MGGVEECHREASGAEEAILKVEEAAMDHPGVVMA
jgi:hypothetical protein